jgi:hypothetical protein
MQLPCSREVSVSNYMGQTACDESVKYLFRIATTKPILDTRSTIPINTKQQNSSVQGNPKTGLDVWSTTVGNRI